MTSAAARPRRLVLDTNVLASALEFGGPPLQVLELGRARLVEIFASPFIMAELAEVLASRKFRWEARRIQESLRELSIPVKLVEPDVEVRAIPAKESDNRILECGLAAKADVIVTGNMRHIRPLARFQGIEILTPREFLDKHFPFI